MNTGEENKIGRIYAFIVLLNNQYLDNKTFYDSYINEKSRMFLSQNIKDIELLKKILLLNNSYVETMTEILNNRLINYDDISTEMFHDGKRVYGCDSTTSNHILFLCDENKKSQKHDAIYNIFREMKIEELAINTEKDLNNKMLLRNIFEQNIN